ncbi:flagellar type III secretion system protein FlhB [Yoonia sp. I 8.24]|uniref:flagellar type III secretion system protein FlhB n=1 Tax=Yoonia sp. I 8.24 TaxID=1537229 RepID=UPI001EDE495C|nr:flagellar type III secretion system protein FlhB [Yoonia sp. I 8.24]MCG3269102.1 flagellar biosynthesis protein FlhB [Yoonia sp. I 8.24]
MSDETDAGEKQFEPSQKKLDDAREKGEFAKSADLNTAAGYAGVLVVVLTVGPDLLQKLGTTLSTMLAQADGISRLVFDGPASPTMGGLIQNAGMNTAPWFVLPAVFAILSIISQRAFVVTPSKITPKLNRISVISGIKNKFGRQGLFEFAKSFAKLLIYCVVMAIFLRSQMDRIVGAMYLPPGLVVMSLGNILLLLMAIVLCVALVLGGIDYLWQRAEHIRKNKMSRKDMIDEMKQSEGDPMMKQQRRMKGQAIAMNKMLADVPAADVVIVNPTHYAVALKWERAGQSAPICVAKGVDETAAKIRELAFENAVPVHSDPPTARALHAGVEIGHAIAPEHYRAVAAAIRFAEAMRRKVRL